MSLPEMDEQWGYVGAKSRQRWLFYAYEGYKAHVFGERNGHKVISFSWWMDDGRLADV